MIVIILKTRNPHLLSFFYEIGENFQDIDTPQIPNSGETKVRGRCDLG